MNINQLAAFIRIGLIAIATLLANHGLTAYADLLNAPNVAAAIVGLFTAIWAWRTHADDPPSPKAPLLVIFLLATGLAVAVPGCTTPPQTIAYQSAAATSLTATTALQAYDVLAANGQTTPQQNAAVKAAYEKYQAAMLLLCDAGAIYSATATTNAPAQAALQAAADNASTTLADLINLVRQLGGKL